MKCWSLVSFACICSLTVIISACSPISSDILYATGNSDAGDTLMFNGTEGPFPIYSREEGRGAPIVMLHGFAASHYTWRYQIADLKRNYRVIAVDLKGFGKSGKPVDGKYSIFDQADLVIQFLRRKNLTNVTLVGHSLGGAVALATTLKLLEGRKKSPIKKLILLDSLAYNQPLPLYMKALRTPGISHIGVSLLSPEFQARTALNYAYYNKKLIPEISVKEYAKPLHTLNGKLAVMQTANQIIPPNLKQTIKKYKQIRHPTLLIWCRHDKIVPLSHGQRLRKDIKTSTLKIVEKCGHNPHEERPEETTMLMRMFLKNWSRR